MSDERICERCHEIWTNANKACPDDGGRLLTIASPTALIGGVIEGKLTLTDVLGQGGMGVVYRARQRSMDREVAVKVLHPSFAGDAEAVRRFLHEARAATRLDRPNIITVFEFGGTDDGLLYTVMELLAGYDLGSLVDVGPIPSARAGHVHAQVADAIHHAHGRGLVHRDLEPEDVFFVQGSGLRSDFVKVLDFGVATMRAQEGADRLTRTGVVCGTPAYMSPQQVLGDRVDARSDVYALGVVAFEMLTGQPPFRAETPRRQMLAHLESEVPTFRDVGAHGIVPAIELAVRRALHKERDERTQSAHDLARDLMGALSSAVTDPGNPGAHRADALPAAPQTSARGRTETTERHGAPVRATPSRLRALLPNVAMLALMAEAVAVLALREPDRSESRETELGLAAPRAPAPIGVHVAMPDGAHAATDAPDARDTYDFASASATLGPPRDASGPSVPVGARVPLVLPIAGDAAGASVVTASPTPLGNTGRSGVAPTACLVTSEPEGAEVLIAGALVGRPPLPTNRPEGGADVTLVLRRRGFYDAELALDTRSEPVLAVGLRKLPAAKATHDFKRND